jgi:hypothetical protein
MRTRATRRVTKARTNRWGGNNNHPGNDKDQTCELKGGPNLLANNCNNILINIL